MLFMHSEWGCIHFRRAFCAMKIKILTLFLLRTFSLALLLFYILKTPQELFDQT